MQRSYDLYIVRVQLYSVKLASLQNILEAVQDVLSFFSMRFITN